MSLSNQFEVTIIDATQPIAGAWFCRWKRRHVRIVNDLIKSDDTHRPAGKAVPDMTVIVYSVGKEFLLAAEYPISSVTVPDAERLIEPSFSFKDADEAVKCIMRLISGYHVPYPVSLVSHFCQDK
ncbi:MAG: hypothetical protein ACXU9G_10345 [Syntrophales bacterium]